MEAETDTLTPRTLVSSLLSQDPSTTLRPPRRQISVREKADRSSLSGGTSQTSSVSKDDDALNQTTPRTLISEALDKLEATKTSRMPTRQIERLQRPIAPEKARDLNSSDDDLALLKFNKKVRIRRIRLSEIRLPSTNESSDSEFIEDLKTKLVEVITNKKLTEHLQQDELQRKVNQPPPSISSKPLSSTADDKKGLLHSRETVKNSSKLNIQIPDTSSQENIVEGNIQTSIAGENEVTDNFNTLNDDVEMTENISKTDGDLISKLQENEYTYSPVEKSIVKENVLVTKHTQELVCENSGETDKAPPKLNSLKDENNSERSPTEAPEAEEMNSQILAPSRHPMPSTDERMLVTEHTTPVREVEDNLGTSADDKNNNSSGKSSSREDVVPASETDVSSNLGPLELSRITEAGEIPKQERHKEKGSAESPMKRAHTPIADIPSASTTPHQEKVRRLSKSEEIMDQYSPTKEPETKTPQTMPKTQMIVHRRVKVKAQKKPYNLPLPKSQLKGIIQHYASMKFSAEAMLQIEKLSEEYLDETAKQLQHICDKNKRKTINLSDMEALMKRRKYINDKNDLNVLIEENLPSEYREELIPVAMAGNKVYP